MPFDVLRIGTFKAITVGYSGKQDWSQGSDWAGGSNGVNEDSDQDMTVWSKSRFEDLGNWIWAQAVGFPFTKTVDVGRGLGTAD